MANKGAEGSKHVWRFFRLGGLTQVRLETAEDLLHLRELDQKLWSAIACPVKGVGLGIERTLELIDTDKDGRIRPPEVLDAVDFACGLLKDAGSLLARRPSLGLDELNLDAPEGQRVLASARRVLESAGKPDAAEITIEDVEAFEAQLAAAPFNGDGILPAAATDDPELKALIEEIISTVGGSDDPGGGKGADLASLEAFFTAAGEYSAWYALGEEDGANLLPLGEATHAMAALFLKLKPKIDDYFTRCRMAAFDERAALALNRSEEDFKALAPLALSPESPEISTFPLARVEAGRPLPLVEGVNPSWNTDLAAFRAGALAPLLGQTETLGEEEWAKVKALFAAHLAWQESKAGAAVEPLGIDRVRELLAGGLKEKLAEHIGRDEAVRPQVEALESLTRLLHYQKDLFTLLNNLVTFSDFYSRRAKAIFQVGTLYLDGRSLDLCLRVDDPQRHMGQASTSCTYLVYCECERRGDGEKMTIAAALTDGDAGNMVIGRHGVFYDRNGRDWDARVIHLLEHPISIRQGFRAPYKKMGRMVGEQMRKFAAAKEKEAADAAAKAIEGGVKTAQTAKPPPQPFDVGKFAGIFAALGLAIGALATAVATILTGFLGLAWWKMPLALIAIALIVSGPSVLLAALNLRNRSLAPILDANGWAVNSNAKLNILFGKSLTVLAKLPENSERNMIDPYAEKSRTWVYLVALGATAALGALAWKFKLVGRLLGVFG